MTRLGSCIQHEGKLQSIYYFDIDIRFEGICLAITCNGLIFCLNIIYIQDKFFVMHNIIHLNPEIQRKHIIIITS